MKDKKENTNGSLANARSPVRTYVERRVKLNDTFLKKERSGNKLRSIGDSEVPGLRIYIHPNSGAKIFYFAYKPQNQKKLGSYKDK